MIINYYVRIDDIIVVAVLNEFQLSLVSIFCLSVFEIRYTTNRVVERIKFRFCFRRYSKSFVRKTRLIAVLYLLA